MMMMIMSCPYQDVQRTATLGGINPFIYAAAQYVYTADAV